MYLLKTSAAYEHKLAELEMMAFVIVLFMVIAGIMVLRDKFNAAHPPSSKPVGKDTKIYADEEAECEKMRAYYEERDRNRIK